jgi:hypothetical protein
VPEERATLAANQQVAADYEKLVKILRYARRLGQAASTRETGVGVLVSIKRGNGNKARRGAAGSQGRAGQSAVGASLVATAS